jgi:2,6-dihydroxypseudooxynicotine hydrolase
MIEGVRLDTDWEVDEATRREIEAYYQHISTQIRLFGAEAMGRRYVGVRLARIDVNSPLDYSDLQRILGGVSDFRSWYPAWRDEARSAERAGDRLAAEGATVSAGQMYLRAALCFHWGQLYLTRLGSPERWEGRAERVRLYAKALPYLQRKVMPLRVPYGGTTLPAYLHAPAGEATEGPPPCVIMVNGADSVKEEYHYWAGSFAERGIAALTFDGPGQGEMVGTLPMHPERWEEPVGAVIDHLEGLGSVDPTRVGLWGSSLGGFLAARAAAFEPRIRAAVSLGGFRDRRDFRVAPLQNQIGVMEDLLLHSLEETREYVAANISLEGVCQRIACPFLVIHGARDELVTVEEAKQMAEEAPRGEFVNFEDGVHTCTNLNWELVPLMGDWMARRLTEEG